MSGPAEGERDGGRGERRSREGTSPLEWVVAGLGTLLVLGTAGFLVRDAASGSSSPPRITVAVDSVLPAGAGYLVEFTARNGGETTAAGLVVEGEMRSGDGSVERSEVTIDFLPAGGSRRAGLFFSEDPRGHRLEIRPKGYDRP
jgi:uncharacterized protein (TIGR02588 family)